MIEDFVDWFINEFINSVIEKAWLAVKIVLFIWVAVLLLPVWILPFIYWFFVERRKYQWK